MEKIANTLLSYMNKEWLYGAKNYVFDRFRISDDDEMVFIVTNHKTFEIPADKIDTFLDSLLPVGGEDKQEKLAEIKEEIKPVRVTIQQPNSIMGDLKTILLEDIKKVREDSNYIPQAKAVTNNVNTIINALKVELEYAKEVKNL
ncbi:hypothetical protein [Flexithrix dorotheae]|uniref:hypothetical protein n=1 Tax=Flexithrix dorotheae TaxID=70993 RepID=UPI000370A76A|nr:hypothetical protein [Flexithrix dorotheae]